MTTTELTKVSDLPEVLYKGDKIFLDTETTGLDKMEAFPFLTLIGINGVQYAVKTDDHLIDYLTEQFLKLYECDGRLVMHNGKFDLHMLMNAGILEEVIRRVPIYCTYVAETLVDEHRFSYHLDDLGKDYFGIGKSDEALYEWLAEHCGGKPTRKAQIKNIAKAPIEMAAYYGIGDIDITERLHKKQMEYFTEEHDLVPVFQLEMMVLKALLFTERRGVPINMEAVPVAREAMERKQGEIRDRLIDLVGFDVNPRSPKQMTAAFEELGLEISYNAKTGNPTFAKDILQRYDHEFIDLIFEQRSVGVMLNTFLAGFDSHVYEDGRIRPNFNQTRGDEYGTRTGRLSCSEPNLQQIPKRNKELASQIRSLFCAPEGYDWFSADWEQFEFRVFGHYSKDEALIERFRENPELDYHQAVADLTGLPRNPYAKQLNLGLVFGMGEGLMAKHCDLPYTEEPGRGGKTYLRAGDKAKQIFSTYHEALPGARRVLMAAERKALHKGYVKTIMGRRLRFPDGKGAHKAGGLIFQGTSADIMKKKLVLIDNTFRTDEIQFVLPVHDEFNFIVSQDLDQKEVKARIKQILEDVPELRIPVLSDVGIASNWWDASK